MNARRQAPRRLGRLIGRSTLVVGSAGLAMLGAGAVAAPSLAPAAAQVLRMQPDHVIGRAAPTGRTSTKASSSSSPCWASSNWSGYALSESTPSGLSCVPASGTTYTSVSATWTVPTVTGSSSSGGRGRHSSSSSTYSAVWTGIDGFSDDDLIQAGTEQDYSGGTASYSAWWEILPAAETTMFSVSPGDQITVSIMKGGCSTVSNPWSISLDDSTSGKSFDVCESYTGPQSSAEWIVEAPEVNGRIASIADYGTATFGYPSAVLTADGGNPELAAGNGGELEQNGSVVSVCSSATGGDAFSCAYGSTAPSPPA